MSLVREDTKINPEIITLQVCLYFLLEQRNFFFPEKCANVKFSNKIF